MFRQAEGTAHAKALVQALHCLQLVPQSLRGLKGQFSVSMPDEGTWKPRLQVFPDSSLTAAP